MEKQINQAGEKSVSVKSTYRDNSISGFLMQMMLSVLLIEHFSSPWVK